MGRAYSKDLRSRVIKDVAAMLAAEQRLAEGGRWSEKRDGSLSTIALFTMHGSARSKKEEKGRRRAVGSHALQEYLVKMNANVLAVDKFRSSKRCPLEAAHSHMRVCNAQVSGGLRSLTCSRPKDQGGSHIMHRDVVGSLWIGIIGIELHTTGARPRALRKPVI